MSATYCPVSGKVQHASAHDATKAKRQGGSVYRCAHCHAWHHSSHTDGTMDRRSRAELRRKRESRA